MVEYIFNAIKATAGEDITIAAEITDPDGEMLVAGCRLKLSTDDVEIAIVDGYFSEDSWVFIVPAIFTERLKGRCWYTILYGDVSISHPEPIYLV